MTEITKAAYALVSAQPEIVALLGSDAVWTAGWIFQESLYVRIENTQKCAVVLVDGEDWIDPNPHNTMGFTRLIVDVWADPTRNVDNSVQTPDAKDKIETVFKAINKHLHNSANQHQIWGSARILDSQLLQRPKYRPVADGNGAFMGRFVYGVVLG